MSFESAAHCSENGLNYSWASKRIDGAFYGFATADLEGDGVMEYLLLGRRRVLVGNFSNEGAFKEIASCDVPGAGDAAKIYAYDLDLDEDEEVVITGTEAGEAVSYGMDYEGGKCLKIFSSIGWSLRVDEIGEKIYGQWWNSQKYFSGPVYELKFENSGLGKTGKVLLPSYVNLYDFDLLNNGDVSQKVLTVKGVAHIILWERVGKKFKKRWKSPEKFGGSINMLEAQSRPLLDEAKSEFVYFNVSPAFIEQDGSRFLAIHQDMPLGGFIGLKTYIRGAEAVVFRHDPAIGAVEVFRTVKLPGPILDYHIDNTGKNGAKELTVLVLEGGGFFEQATSSMLLKFDIQ